MSTPPTIETNAEPAPIPVPAGWIPRRDVRAQLGWSDRTIGRHVETGELRMQRDASGACFYSPDDVDRLAPPTAAAETGTTPAAMSAASAPTPTPPDQNPDPTDDGKLQAKVFALFAAGRTRRQIVIELQIPARVVQLVYRDWLLLAGDDLFARDDLREARALLGASTTPKSIVATLKKWAPEVTERRTFTFPCARCGRQALATRAAWQAVLESGALDTWAHGECAK